MRPLTTPVRRVARATLSLISLVAAVQACGPATPLDAGRDASADGVGAEPTTDGAPAEATAPDSEAPDSQAPDSEAPDSEALDSNVLDAEALDTTPGDATPLDARGPDAPVIGGDATPLDAPDARLAGDATVLDAAREASLGDAGLDASAPDARADAARDVPAPDAADAAGSPIVRHTYRANDTIIANPERGFYRYTSLPDDRDFSRIVSQGYRLIFSYVRLDAYRTRRIDDALLTQLSSAFAAVRAAGLSVVLRFAYNDGPYPDSEPDASRAMVLTHIGQLTPLLRANADVIYVLQAGFIGAWGEWHTSTNMLDNPTDQRAIVGAILDALPADRMTQLRYPPVKVDLFGPARTADTAFDGSQASRIGHHNDCLLSSATDVGTYPRARQAELERYIAQDALYVPIGGETCDVFPARSDCSFAAGELERLHYTYINDDYHPDVIAGWRTMGCHATLERRLGYRFALTSADFADTLRAGESTRVSLALRNDGFAPMYNPRPVFLRFDQAGRTELVALPNADPRRWTPGAHTIDATITVPSTLEAGTVELSLWIPHASEPLRARSIYSVRLANDTVWNDARGTNTLGTVRVTR